MLTVEQLLDEVTRKHQNHDCWDYIDEIFQDIVNNGAGFEEIRQLGYVLDYDIEDKNLALEAFRLCLPMSSNEDDYQLVLDMTQYIDEDLWKRLNADKKNAITIFENYLYSENNEKGAGTSEKKTYSDEFKIKVANATQEDGATLKSVGEKFGVNPTLVRNWRIKFLDNETNDKENSGMKKYDALDQEKNPDGIATPLSGLDDEVWDRGYYCETDDGIWYEVYANENIKEIWGDFELEDPEEKEMFEGFSDFNVSMFGDYGQITFFVAKGDDENTLDALTEIFI